MERLAAIVTTYNRADFIHRCCAALRDAAHDQLEVRILVMDNGSTDNTAAIAQELGGCVRVLRTPDNRPIVEVINRGMRAATSDEAPDYLLILNDDTEFLPGAIERLLAAARTHPHALLTPLQLDYHRRGHVDANALRLAAASHALVEDALLGRPLGEVYPQRTIIGAAMLARTETWRDIGDFDELFWFTGSDDDYCNRALWLGYEVLLVPAAHMFHAHGGLQPSDAPPDKASVLRKYRLGLQARYLFILKDPAASLPLACLRATAYAVQCFFGCAKTLWLPGMWTVLRLYAHCCAMLPRIAARRRSDYDPARRRI